MVTFYYWILSTAPVRYEGFTAAVNVTCNAKDTSAFNIVADAIFLPRYGKNNQVMPHVRRCEPILIEYRDFVAVIINNNNMFSENYTRIK